VNTCPQNYKFTGKERDSETGNDYFGARYHASNFARFLSVDPVSRTAPRAGIVGNPQGWNAYAYASGNPLVNIDRDGRFTAKAHTPLTEQPAKERGYSAASTKLLVDANLRVDLKRNALNNKEHGMSGTYDRSGAAEILGVIGQRKNEAVQKAIAGDVQGALQSLGAGLHTVQDFVAHEGKRLIDHTRTEDAQHDRDPAMVTNAYLQTTQYLSGFEAAIIQAVGAEKGQEIISAVKGGHPVAADMVIEDGQGSVQDWGKDSHEVEKKNMK
jgi:RHS repeat-associated protein